MRLGNLEMPFYWRLLAGAAFPTGDYDHDKDFNAGYNLTTYITYYSFTAFMTRRWSTSGRFMYYFHSKNSEFGPEKMNLRVSQLFNFHFATCYEIRPSCGYVIKSVGVLNS